MFDVKICGVRFKSDIDAVQSAVSLAADAGLKRCRIAVGLNFFPPSSRYLDSQSTDATAISMAAARAGVLRVGLFVNENPDNVARIADQIGLGAVQLHGDETQEQVAAIADVIDLPIIRAVKLPAKTAESDAIQSNQIAAACQPWLDLGCHLLLDADAGTQHGGSGKSLDWHAIKAWADTIAGDVAWTLAGGLTPDNVAEAMEVSGATSVDTASGVEASKGVKSAEKIAAFVRQSMSGLKDPPEKPTH